MQDMLTGALIGLARATDGNEHLINPAATAVIVDGLASAFDPSADYAGLLGRVEEVKRSMVPDCFLCASPCGKNNAYNMEQLLNEEEDVRNLKHLLLLGIRGMALFAREAAALSCRDDQVDRFFYKALIVIGLEGFSKDDFLPILSDLGNVNQKCLELLEKARSNS